MDTVSHLWLINFIAYENFFLHNKYFISFMNNNFIFYGFINFSQINNSKFNLIFKRESKNLSQEIISTWLIKS